MKKIIMLTVVCIFILTSCTSVFTEDTNTDEYKYQTFEKQNIDITANNEKSVSLYFLSSEYDRLVAETRIIQIGEGEKYSEKIIEELLKGPEDNDLRTILSDCKLQKIESLYNIENIYLTSDIEHSEDVFYIFALAAANTIYNFSGKPYVNVFVNGKPITYGGYPTGCVSYNQGIIADETAAVQQKATSMNYYTALYFIDESGEFLVPEIRSISYENNDYAKKIIEELINGPETTNYKRSVNDSISVNGSMIIKEEDSETNILVVDINKSLSLLSDEDKNNTISAIVYSVLGFVPEADGIRFTVNGREDKNSQIYYREDFSDKLGNEITLYFAQDSGIILSGVKRTVSQQRAGLTETIIEELIKGPKTSEGENLVRICPESVTEYDINQVYIASDIAVVNLSSSILPKVEGMTETEEKIMIYAIVDSLTYLQGIKSVQFLIDGRRVNSLCGYIDISDPILKNPGIIKY